jgi:hypothetical protein
LKLTENKTKRATSLLSERKNGENGLGQRAGFASVQRFAEKETVLGTRLLKERREVALRGVMRGAWEHLDWEKKAIVPKGLQLAANGCDGPLQANLRRKAGSPEICDEESVKPEASVTPIDSSNRKVVEMCMLACAAVLC